MNKISGILPSNSRITSVDMSKVSPTRRGHPNVGQPVVDGSLSRAMAKTVLKEASGAYGRLNETRTKNKENFLKDLQIQNEFFSGKLDSVKDELAAGKDEMLNAITTTPSVEVGTRAATPMKDDDISMEALTVTSEANDGTAQVGTNLSVIA